MPNQKNLKPWKKGESGNPKGRPPLSAEARAMRRLTADALTQVISQAAAMTRAELRAALTDPGTPALTVWVYRGFLKAAKYGDAGALAPHMDRAIGKVVEKRETTHLHEGRLKGMTNQDLIKEHKRAIAWLESQEERAHESSGTSQPSLPGPSGEVGGPHDDEDEA